MLDLICLLDIQMEMLSISLGFEEIEARNNALVVINIQMMVFKAMVLGKIM